MEAFIAAGDSIVRYSKFGKGEKYIVLLHGYGQSLDTFEDIAGQLGKEHTVILIDLPGSGFSTWGEREIITVDYMADIVIEVLTKLAIENYYLIGHSMGGYVAAAITEKDASRINSLMLLHSLPYADTEERIVNRKREIELILAEKKEMLVSTNPLKGFAPQNAKKCSEQIEEKIEQFLLTPDEALVATLKGLMERCDRTTVLCDFAATKPLYIIFGAHDPYIAKELWDITEEKLPKATIKILENSAHMGYREEQGESISFINEML